MPQSMTGFGHARHDGEFCTLHFDIKSYNQRFKDIRIKSSSFFQSYEFKIRKKIEQSFSRGTFEVFLYFKNKNETEDILINWKKIDKFLNEIKEKSQGLDVSLTFSPKDFLIDAFLLKEENSLEKIDEIVDELLLKATQDLTQSRQKEGEILIQDLLMNLDLIKDIFTKIVQEKPNLQEKFSAKFIEKLTNFSKKLVIDENRLGQEIVYYLEKLDVAEELTRIEHHINKINEIIQEQGGIGKKIEFYLQELNREVNTLSVKSSSHQLSDLTIQIKVLLEKMREQCLNLE